MNIAERSKKWRSLNRAKNKTQSKLRMRAYTNRIRLKVLAHYSNGTPKCSSCGIEDIRVLSIDHINGKGNEHRLKLGLRIFLDGISIVG